MPKPSLRKRLTSPSARKSTPLIRILLGSIAIVVVSLLVIDAYVNGALDTVIANTLTPSIPYFALRTLTRMTIAYALALSFALAYGISTAMSHRASHVLLPLLDIF